MLSIFQQKLSTLTPTHCTKHESVKNQHDKVRLEDVSLVRSWPHLMPRAVCSQYHGSTSDWNVSGLGSSAVCPVASNVTRQIWNTKTRALSFTISNRTYLVYTGTELWTEEQCSGQTHLVHTFKTFIPSHHIFRSFHIGHWFLKQNPLRPSEIAVLLKELKFTLRLKVYIQMGHNMC